jgi:mono/diheme cytochrome c family protein
MMNVSTRRAANIVAAALLVAALSLPARGEPSHQQTYFTARQAQAGAAEYGAYCAVCHGTNLAGPQIPLKGPAFASLGRDTGMTLGMFFNFLVRDTPAGSISSLSHEQYVEIMAYIMQQNGYAAGPQPLRFERAVHLNTLISEQPATPTR